MAFSFADILNQKSRAGGAPAAGYEEIWLNPYEVEPAPENFYSQENIEELADSIYSLGQQQPIVLGRVAGKMKIISGHRRNRANIHNIECGRLSADAKIKYLYKDMTPAQFEIELLAGNMHNRKLTAYEEMEQAKRLTAALQRMRDEDGEELPGKLRKYVAALMGVAETKVAMMSKIDGSATPELKEEFKAGNIGITDAYEASRLPEDEQRQIIKERNIKERIIERKEQQKTEKEQRDADRQQEPTSGWKEGAMPEPITLPETVEIGGNTVSESDTRKVDQETGEIIGKEHYIRYPRYDFLRAERGTLTYTLQKSDRDYKEGDMLDLHEFADGETTGRIIKAQIMHMTEDCAGLAHGYCILGYQIIAIIGIDWGNKD